MTNRLKLECCHVDTCLPCYWSGHHLPHVQIPAIRGMTLGAIKEAIMGEIRQGAVAGNNDIAFLLSSDFVGQGRERDADKATKAAYAAIRRMKPATKGQRKFFLELEEQADDDSESVYAYFVFKEVE